MLPLGETEGSSGVIYNVKPSWYFFTLEPLLLWMFVFFFVWDEVVSKQAKTCSFHDLN